MIDYKNFDLYTGETVDKQLQITFDGGTITNKEIPSEQFELTESLTSESQLVFGSCEASEIRFRIYNVFTPLKDKWLTITQTLNGDTENALQIGRYKVYSDKPTADRSYRDVVAYDSMYDIINTDVASWYNSLTFPMSLKSFRYSFFAFFGIEQENVSLANDLMNIERTIEPQTLSGRDVIASICQLNGCFGHIARNGKFKYVFLKSIVGGLYPSNDIYPANDLFPQQPNVQIVGKGLYVDTPTYEDYTVKPIDKLQIREKEGDIGVIVGNGNNTYIVEDNFLVYGKSTEDLTVIANNMLSVIDGLEYRPFDAELVGNPCFEVGDMVRLNTKYQIIDSYVLQRTLSGIQALRDDWSAEGEEYQSEKVNDIQTQITQLKGKSNTLERTIEETRSTISDVEKGLQSQITQTAESIRLEVSNIDKNLSSEIEQTAESIRLEVADETNQLSSEIEQLAGQIVLSVNNQGRIVSVELSANPSTGSLFSVGADNINLTAEEVISLMAGGTINLTSQGLDISSTNFIVTDAGNVVAKGLVDVNTLSFRNAINFITDNSSTSIIGGSLSPTGVYSFFIGNSVIDNMYFTAKNNTVSGNLAATGNMSASEYFANNKSALGYGSSTDFMWVGNNDIAGLVLRGETVKLKNSSGTTVTSDERLKNSLKSLEEFEETYMDLEPIAFKYNNGTSDRFHFGFGANQVKETILKHGYTTKDFAGFVQSVDSPDSDDYCGVVDPMGLIYTEFISWNTHMIQKAYKKIETQQQEIDTLKEQVSFLMQKLGDDVNG